MPRKAASSLAESENVPEYVFIALVSAEALRTLRPTTIAMPSHGLSCLLGIKPASQGILSEFVIEFSLFVISQDIIGAGDKLKFLFGLLASRIDVGMPFPCQLSVSLLYVLGGSSLGYPKYFIQILSHKFQLHLGICPRTCSGAPPFGRVPLTAGIASGHFYLGL